MPSKKVRLQLYADECFPLTSVRHLKSAGISIIHVFDKNYIGKSDAFHLKQTKKLKRVLITADRDFLYYKKASLLDHPGVIVVKAASNTASSINIVCDLMLKKLTLNRLYQSLYMLTKSKISKIR